MVALVSARGHTPPSRASPRAGIRRVALRWESAPRARVSSNAFALTLDIWCDRALQVMQLELKAPATDGDWAAYHAIRRRVLFELRGNGAAYDEHHPDETRPGHHPLLLWAANTPVGTIRVDVDGARAFFRRVAIREDLQGRGYGRQLLEAAERFARQQRCTRIESYVDPDAVGFYEKCGFGHAESSESGHAAPLMTKDVA